MKIAISGICGFVGSSLAIQLKHSSAQNEIVGIDNFSRVGSEINRDRLRGFGIQVLHGDVRKHSDVELFGNKIDWLIDCAAIPTVTAGTAGASTSSLALVEHNLFGTVNLLEFCKRTGAGFVLISTSRIYSTAGLNALPLASNGERFDLDPNAPFPGGLSERGISESFSTQAPVSLYGATKLSSEVLALEYGEAYSFPVWINRCGVIAGPGQFGKADQGILSYWVYSYLAKKNLSYIGYGGEGLQVRDFLSPSDLGALLDLQLRDGKSDKPKILNVGGGLKNSLSLKQLSEWCDQRFGKKQIGKVPENRKYDVPYYVTDFELASMTWKWKPAVDVWETLESVASWADENEILVRRLVDAH